MKKKMSRRTKAIDFDKRVLYTTGLGGREFMTLFEMLPVDARLVGMYEAHMTSTFVFESEEFDEVPEFNTIPRMNVHWIDNHDGYLRCEIADDEKA